MAGWNTRHVVNMANSIVGVSILSMPYCFKETGLLLGVLMVLFSGVVTKKTCMYLVRAATMARHHSYEFLAFHVFGVRGKLAVEVCMILFLVGICISFHVVMGDLAPALFSQVFDVPLTPSLRATLLLGIAVLVVLPLCLLRKLDNLASMSACSILFYFFLITVIFWHALPRLVDGSWYQLATLWRPTGVLQVFPICMLGLSCQSNVFEIYDSVQDADVTKMRSVVNNALNLCCALYISVGFFGYIAFVDQDLAGNVIINLPATPLTEGIKLFFTVSLAISFPLMIFPCRTSIHSLVYCRHHQGYDLVRNYMPESRFKGITIGILGTSLIVGILIPNIEFVLGMLGSTMGVIISLVLPCAMFIKVNSKASTERLVAQFIMMTGVLLIVTGSYLNLTNVHSQPIQQQQQQLQQQEDIIIPQLEREEILRKDTIELAAKNAPQPTGLNAGALVDDTRREPVAPEPPVEPQGEEEAMNKDNLDTKLKIPGSKLKNTSKLGKYENKLNRADIKLAGDGSKLKGTKIKLESNLKIGDGKDPVPGPLGNGVQKGVLGSGEAGLRSDKGGLGPDKRGLSPDKGEGGLRKSDARFQKSDGMGGLAEEKDGLTAGLRGDKGLVGLAGAAEEVEQKQQEILEKIEVQHKEQQIILAEQKKILQELKDQKEQQQLLQLQQSVGVGGGNIQPQNQLPQLQQSGVVVGGKIQPQIKNLKLGSDRGGDGILELKEPLFKPQPPQSGGVVVGNLQQQDQEPQLQQSIGIVEANLQPQSPQLLKSGSVAGNQQPLDAPLKQQQSEVMEGKPQFQVPQQQQSQPLSPSQLPQSDPNQQKLLKQPSDVLEGKMEQPQFPRQPKLHPKPPQSDPSQLQQSGGALQPPSQQSNLQQPQSREQQQKFNQNLKSPQNLEPQPTKNSDQNPPLENNPRVIPGLDAPGGIVPDTRGEPRPRELNPRGGNETRPEPKRGPEGYLDKLSEIEKLKKIPEKDPKSLTKDLRDKGHDEGRRRRSLDDPKDPGNQGNEGEMGGIQIPSELGKLDDSPDKIQISLISDLRDQGHDEGRRKRSLDDPRDLANQGQVRGGLMQSDFGIQKGEFAGSDAREKDLLALSFETRHLLWGERRRRRGRRGNGRGMGRWGEDYWDEI